MKKIWLVAVILVLVWPMNILAASRHSGRIYLAVEEKGEAWFVSPTDEMRYYLGRPMDAFNVMKSLGLGISNKNLNKIPVGFLDNGGIDTDKDGLPNDLETALGTKANIKDSDGDGFEDKSEVVSLNDPKTKNKLTLDTALTNRLKGRILLQTEGKGEAWYLNPGDGKRYFLGRPEDAFLVMRKLGIGITSKNLSSIVIDKKALNQQPAVKKANVSSSVVNVKEIATKLVEVTTTTSNNPVPPVQKVELVKSSDVSCLPLAKTHGKVFTAASVAEIREAVKYANSNGDATILIKDGVYNFDVGFVLSGNKITVRSLSGDREKVTLKGPGMSKGSGNVFWVQGNDITIADMTIGWVKNHPIQVQGELEADNVLIHNMNIYDGREQLVKVSTDFKHPEIVANNGILECSNLGFTGEVAAQNYTGGIDAHHANDWIVRNNNFFNIVSPNSTLAEYAVHFWSGSENTLVENNVIVNCDRGIGFGLSNNHIGGVIRGNKIYNNRKKGDTGIGLWHAQGKVVVENNIVILTHNYFDAMEYRFADTLGVIIRNNVVNKPIMSREGGVAELSGNKTKAELSWFKDPLKGDFTYTDKAPAELR